MTAPPDDWEHPNWEKAERVHNWRNYVSVELTAMWKSFTAEQKMAIARNADEIAGREEWE